MAHLDVLTAVADAIEANTTLVKGTSLFLGPPDQVNEDQIHVTSGGVPAASTWIYFDGGRPPELHFGRRVSGELSGWWYPGLEVQTRSAPRDYKGGHATALEVHRILAALTDGSTLLRTQLTSSAPELRPPNRQGQHVFVTRASAWYFNDTSV